MFSSYTQTGAPRDRITRGVGRFSRSPLCHGFIWQHGVRGITPSRDSNPPTQRGFGSCPTLPGFAPHHEGTSRDCEHMRVRVPSHLTHPRGLGSCPTSHIWLRAIEQEGTHPMTANTLRARGYTPMTANTRGFGSRPTSPIHEGSGPVPPHTSGFAPSSKRVHTP